jgi:hypothetical protein
MKRLIIVFAFLHSFVYSQLCPFLGPDQFLPCGVNSTTLTADLSQCSGGNNPNQTTNYTVHNKDHLILDLIFVFTDKHIHSFGWVLTVGFHLLHYNQQLLHL